MAVEMPIFLVPLNVVVPVVELVPPQAAATNSAAVARTSHPVGFLTSEINLPLLRTLLAWQTPVCRGSVAGHDASGVAGRCRAREVRDLAGESGGHRYT